MTGTSDVDVIITSSSPSSGAPCSNQPAGEAIAA
jgi:hypothetical protein